MVIPLDVVVLLLVVCDFDVLGNVTGTVVNLLLVVDNVRMVVVVGGFGVGLSIGKKADSPQPKNLYRIPTW